MICTYQDYAEEDEAETSALTEKVDQESPEQIVFPVKLHNMLSQVEKQGLSNVVGWATHGRCFLVHNKSEFVSRILASWFRQSKFASFQRQLNLYGFKRITTGPDKGGYYHELFLRGKAFLCNRIERVKIKGSKPGRIKAYADAEPDFYRMRAMPTEEEENSAADTQTASTAQHQPFDHTGGAQVLPQASFAASSHQGGNTGSQAAHDGSGSAQQSNRFAMIRPNLSFLSGQLEPVPIMDRSSPSAGETKVPDDSYHPFQFGDSTLNAMLQPSVGALALGGANLKQAQEGELLSGRRNSAFGLLPGSSFTSPLSGPANAANTFTNLHPILQASGRTNLVSMRENNAGVIGGTITGGDASSQSQSWQQQLQQHSSLDVHANFASPQAASLNSASAVSGASWSNQQQASQNQSHQLSIDMMEMPNELLSQYLPTAESLALEDLFENETHSTMATTAAFAANLAAMHQQQRQPLTMTSQRVVTTQHQLEEHAEPMSTTRDDIDTMRGNVAHASGRGKANEQGVLDQTQRSSPYGDGSSSPTRKPSPSYFS